jgi:hypothetical protein
MSSQPIARRLRTSSEFTCSHCGGHEAYRCQSSNALERLVLNTLMVQPSRCCDCDALCYAFPVRLSRPASNSFQRTPLLPNPLQSRPPAFAAVARESLLSRPRVAKASRPAVPRDFRPATSFAMGD